MSNPEGVGMRTVVRLTVAIRAPLVGDEYFDLHAHAQRVYRAGDSLDVDGAIDKRRHRLWGARDARQCCREFFRRIAEAEAQLEFFDNLQRRHETMRCRVDDL